ARREVAVVMNLDPARDAQVAQDLAHGGVRDLVERLAVLDQRVDDAEAVLEEGRQMPAREVAVLVDGGREYRPPMHAGPRGIVRATPEERDAERRATDDHGQASSACAAR